jgi:hypothetical protein
MPGPVREGAGVRGRSTAADGGRLGYVRDELDTATLEGGTELASEGLHEPAELLGPDTIDRHRAYVSLREELEAIDWYDQRIQATEDTSLAAVLTNSRDDEKEHASMTLEWLRRHDPALDEQLRRFLFTTAPLGGSAAAGTGPAIDAEGDDAANRAADSAVDGSLAIASLKGRE